MTDILNLVNAIRSPFEVLWNVLNFFPDFISVVLILAVGYIFGVLLGHVLMLILDKIGLDKKVEKSELSKAIGKTHLSSVFCEILKWYVFIVFMGAAVERFDLGILSDTLNNLVIWLPNLIFAVVIVMFGMIFAHYVEIKINETSKVKGMYAISRILKWIIIFMIVLVALKQIGLDVAIVENAFLLVLGALSVGIALALGISLGFGLRKDGERWVKEFFRNF